MASTHDSSKSRRISSRPQLLLALDRYAGIPICFALTLLQWIVRRVRNVEPNPPRSILFIKFAEQGSTVLAHQALRDAVRRVGGDNVYFWVFEENRFVIDLLNVVPRENVLAVHTGNAASMAKSVWKQLLELRRLQIDACIDLEFFARSSAILSWLSGARMRIGFHTYFGDGPYRGDLLTHRVLYNPHLHTSETFQTLVAAVDLDPSTLPTFDYWPTASDQLPSFEPTAEETAAVRAILQEVGGQHERRLVLLNANCSDLLPLRRWADENYVALATELLALDEGVAVAFTGNLEEAPRANELARVVGSKRCFSLAGRTTLRDLLVLYTIAEVLVTNDSGPAHFAALTPIDAITLFGPETPRLFAATGPRSHPIWAEIACSPCVNAFNTRQSACRDNVCMKRIAVGQVLQTAVGILKKRAFTSMPAQEN